MILNSCVHNEFIWMLIEKILLRKGCIVVWVEGVSDSNCLGLLWLSIIVIWMIVIRLHYYIATEHVCWCLCMCAKLRLCYKRLCSIVLCSAMYKCDMTMNVGAKWSLSVDLAMVVSIVLYRFLIVTIENVERLYVLVCGDYNICINGVTGALLCIVVLLMICCCI